MKKITLFLILFSLVSAAYCQTLVNRDPGISSMVDEISSERIEQNVRKLVSFHTRHNLSSKNDPQQGIGADEAM